MSDDILDALSLDAMLTGEEKDPALWEALLRAPDASTLWEEAIERREKIERSINRVGDREWLARALLELRRAGRRLRQVAASPISGSVFDPASMQPVLSPLGDGDTERFQLAWGELRELNLALGRQFQFELEEEARFFYLEEQGYVALEEGAWVLEEGDAPVLILALRSADASLAPELALEQGAPFAYVMLLEGGSGEP